MHNREYYAKRAEQERQNAATAESPVARTAHRDLAGIYASLAVKAAEPLDGQSPATRLSR